LKPGVQDFFFGYHMVAVSANGGMWVILPKIALC
jgi:hypothetical protein